VDPHEREWADMADRLALSRREVVLHDTEVLERLEGAVSHSVENVLDPARGVVRGVLSGMCLWLFLTFAAFIAF
jgi:hypothetical protein